MKIIIVGAGEVGVNIAKQLVSEDKDVVIIDKDSEKVKIAGMSIDCMVIQGEGTHLETLRSAGIESADVFIAATFSDEVNLISCFIVASEFNVPIKVARVRNMEYTKSGAFSSKLSGVDYLVNTDREAGWEVIQTVLQGAGSTITIFKNTDVQLRDYVVDTGSPFIGKTVMDVRMSFEENFIIAGVVHDGVLQIPKGNFVIREGDILYIATLLKNFYKISRRLGKSMGKLKKIAVVGGTPIGKMVAEILAAKGRSVVLIDKDYDKCKRIAESLPEALVLNGDISDSEFYEQENIGSMDAIVTTTSNEELNIISAVYSKTLGVKRAVAVVEKTSYLTVAASIGIDSTVSPKFCAINSILKLIRKGSVQSIHSIFDGQAEAIEAVIKADSKLVNIPLKDMVLPEDCLVVAVKRGKKTLIPHGNLQLFADDSVIFFVHRDDVAALEELLI